jgi:PAS domain S-box-containing protein
VSSPLAADPAAPAPPPDGDAVLDVVAAAVAGAAAAAEDEARLRALVGGLRALGFARVVLEVRDTALARTRLAAEGFDEETARSLPELLVPGRVWRRWLRLLERRRAPLADGAGWWLDLRDPWARDEFGFALGAPAPAAVGVVPVRGPDGAVAATLLLGAEQAAPPAPAVARGVALLAAHVGQECARADLAALAAQRAERLRRLYDAGGALARVLDAQEVVRELARQVARLVPHDGLVVAHPDVERGVVRTAYRQLQGLQRPRAEQALGAGPIAEVARSGVAVRVDDYDPTRSPLAAADDVVGDGGPARSVLAVPMRVGTQLVGVLAVHAAAPRAFDGECEELLRTLAAQAGTALANARLFAESEAERRQSEALVAVARAVGASLRLGEVLRLVLRHAAALLRAEGACVALRRDGWLHVVAGVGSVELLAGVHLPVDGSLPGRAVAEGAPVVRNDVAQDPGAFGPLDGVVAIAQTVVVPLRAAEGVIGAIAVVNRATDFGAGDARVLERLAEQVAVAIVNARLFEEVDASTREWQVSFDAIAAGMAVLDEDGRVLRANARAAELLGAADARALAGASLDARIAGEDDTGRRGHAPLASVVAADDARGGDDARPTASALVQRAVRGGAAARGLVRGPARVLDLVAAPRPGGGAVVTFDDVTARLALEDRYRSLVESASDAIFTADAEGRLTSVNRAMELGTGRDRAALLGQHCSAAADPRDREEVVAMLDATMRGGRVRRELRYRDRKGRPRVASATTAPIVTEGAVEGVLGVLRDVTAERRMGEQLLQREKLAAMGQLVSGVAHELNNPLAGVLAFSELLLGEPALAPAAGPAARELRELAETVHGEARRAARIVGKLLAFARQHPPQRTATDLNRVLLEALDLRRYALRAQQVDIALALDYELPATAADGPQLQQVFLNLITNAEHALLRRPADRRLTARTRAEGERLFVEVADNGPGLTEEERARIFEPFYTTKPVGQGTGLGLAVSAGIVRDHDGRLSVESAPGAGATFVVELPWVAPAREAAPA